MEIVLDEPEPAQRTTAAVEHPAPPGRQRRWSVLAAGIAVVVAIVSHIATASAPDRFEAASDPLGAPLETQLRDALDAGDERTALALVDRGAYVYQQFADGSLVDRAIARCNVEALRILQRMGVSRLDPVHGDDVAMPHFLARCDPEQTLDYLAYAGGDLSAVDRMDLAVAHGSLALINWMVVIGYPTAVAGEWSALAEAVRVRRDDALALLLELGADPGARVGDATVAELAARGPATAFARAALDEAAGGPSGVGAP